MLPRSLPVRLASCIPQTVIALCQNSIISQVKGHHQGAKSHEPKIRSPSWAVLSRKTQSLFLFPALLPLLAGAR